MQPVLAAVHSASLIAADDMVAAVVNVLHPRLGVDLMPLLLHHKLRPVPQHVLIAT